MKIDIKPLLILCIIHLDIKKTIYIVFFVAQRALVGQSLDQRSIRITPATLPCTSTLSAEQ